MVAKINNIKKFLKNLFLRTSAGIISTGTQQLIILPLLASFFSAKFYGIILTIWGVFNTISVGFGNSLNNVRQISNSEYDSKKIEGDFNIIILFSSLISVGVFFGVISIFYDISEYDVLILVPSIFVATLNAYYLVYFYLSLKFSKLFLNSIISSVGAIVGIVLVKFTSLWPLSLLFSGLCSLIYLFVKTPLIRESFRITPLFCKTIRKYIVLLVTVLIGQALIYLDRLILFPLLGGEAVSIYSTASFFGKSLAVILGPLSSLLLGYYCQGTFVMTLRKFWYSNVGVIVMVMFFIILALLLSPWITGLLFPSLIDMSMPYIYICNISAIIGISSAISRSAVLKFANINWQIVLETVYAILFVGGGLLVIPQAGLIGFCYLMLAVNVFQFILLLIIGHYSIKLRVE